MDLNELQQHLNKIMREENTKPRASFQGYSSSEMNHILYDTFGDNSPIQIKKINDTDYQRIPIFRLVSHLMNILLEQKELKLTQKGYLPVKIVSELYFSNDIEEKYIKVGLNKLNKETDSAHIRLTHILLKISGLAKKRNNKLSLTNKGKKALTDKHELFTIILNAFTKKFNWAYLDGYGENQIGQLGYGFSLILLSFYGLKERDVSFYGKKYFEAFPQLLRKITSTYISVQQYAENCYAFRTFEHFMKFFGLVNLREEGNFWEKKMYVSKAEVFDKLFNILPPKAI
ncbi:MAG: hypothetical protein ACOC3T_03480 [Bacteroidota bacterium]